MDLSVISRFLAFLYTGSASRNIKKQKQMQKNSTHAYPWNPRWSSQLEPRLSLELVRPSCEGLLGLERFVGYHREDPDHLHVVYFAPSVHLQSATSSTFWTYR